MKKRLSSSARKGARRKGGRVTLERALSKLGFTSRSQAGKIIAGGEVTVDGRVTRDPGLWIDLVASTVEVRGESTPRRTPRTLVLHKPVDVVTTRSDELGRRTIYDLLGQEGADLKPAGRLDRDSSGALILSTDHQLLDAFTDPTLAIPKEYRVATDVPLDDEAIERLRRGVRIRIRGATVETKRAHISRSGDRQYTVVITEGKNRQIRRMFESVGALVIRLTRVRIGEIQLGSLPVGGTRPLTKDETDYLATVLTRRRRNARH